jgi:cell shape-determining protein MreC
MQIWSVFSMNESMTLEERIIKVAEEPLGLWAVQRNKRELRAIALEVRKLEDRLKQLEAENDALRADLLLWNEKEVKL